MELKNFMVATSEKNKNIEDKFGGYYTDAKTPLATTI
jgi:hypothetical protein